MRSLYGYLAVAVLGGWLIASAVGQLPVERFQRLRRWDPGNLIPEWTFFAPNPGIHDAHLLYRDLLEDGTLTEWREIPLLEPRIYAHTVWNPNSRQEKAVFDAISELKIRSAYTDQKSLQVSVPYLALLNFVSSLFHEEGANATQYLVAESTGIDLTEEPSMVFLSNLHGL